MTQREIRCTGPDGSTTLHAIRNESGEWHWSAPAWAGVIRGPQRTIVSALADAIGRGEVYRLDVYPENFMLCLDRLGNTWHNEVYWTPGEYLPEITGDEAEAAR